MTNEPIPICEAEQAILARLRKCRLGCFNQAARFVEQVQNMTEMTPQQYAYACGLVVSYRKQMHPMGVGGK